MPENTQTLFRFRTQRAPELLSDEAKNNYYITHPDGTSGPFYAAVAAKLPSEKKHTVLVTAALIFTGKKTKEEILTINPDLSAFGLYLTKKKNKLKATEVATEISGLTALTPTKELELWDSLFYQTITLDSGYTRESILQLILANYFLNEYSGMTLTDESLRKWAKSRVVMPLELFEIENKYLTQTTDNDLASGEDVLMHFIEAAEAKMKSDLVAKAVIELNEFKDDYFKTNGPIEKAAIVTHQAAIKTARAAASTTPFTDQATQFTFDRLVNYSTPAFTYQKPEEVDSNKMTQAFTEETLHLIQEKNLFNTKTFEEMTDKLSEESGVLMRSIFDKTAFYSEKVAVDGTIFSRCGIEHRFNKKHAFMIKLVQKATDKFGAILTVDVGSDCLKIDNVVSNFQAPISSAFTARKGVVSKGILTVDLLPDNSIDLSSQIGVDVSGELLFSNGTRLSFSNDTLPIGGFMSGVMTMNSNSGEPTDLFIPSGYGITRLGIADYRKVEQTLCCYVPGEVAHIENVMAREYKERSTRRLRRSEESTSSSSSSESENMTDTSSTTRFDMQNEVSKVLSDTVDRSISAGVNSNVSGKNTVPIEVDFSVGGDLSSDFATSSSSEESSSQSTSFAKDVTEKAMQRVVSKVSEERTSMIIEEFEEKNQHGFDNRQGAEHISGVFRWVDKVYKNEVQNYGKRLQYEFMIPEPSAFHLIAKASGALSDSDIPLVKPLDPRKNSFGVLPPIHNPAHVKDDNYEAWSANYGAVVSTPPDKKLTVGKTLIKPQDGTPWHETKVVQDQIIIPKGYGVKRIYISGMGNGDKSMIDGNDGWDRFIVSVGGITDRYWTDTQPKILFATDYEHPELIRYEGTLPVSAQFTGFDGGIVSINVELNRKRSIMEEWQLDTFNAILNAYESKLQEYKDAIAEMEARKGILMGDNPAYYRRIENTVLKKNCISYLVGHNNFGKSFTTGLEMNNNQVRLTEELDKYSATVKFFEQAFEWDIMDYHFYPFYWANRDKWSELYGLENDDALFRSFLRAGMARTVVTVRPGFEELVMYYMATGLIWNGGEVPVIGDDLYLSIMEELAEPEFTLDETWETRLPSTLTVIQAKTIGLDADGLPCYCDEGNPPVETIAKPEVDPLAGLDVHIDGLTPPA